MADPQSPEQEEPITGNALDKIYNDPETTLALDLFNRFRKNSLKDDIADYFNTLPPSAAPEIEKIKQLADNPAARVEADLSTRGGQLAWAAALGFAKAQPGKTRHSAVWKALMRNQDVRDALGTAARFVDLSVSNRNVTMNWGTPGSWFYFSPDKNHINIDLFHALLLGFGKPVTSSMRGVLNATAATMHEVGHSQLSTRWTDGMLALNEQDKALMEIGEQRKLTRDEYKQLMRIRAEFKLRANIRNAMEDNCVNQFAVNKGRDLPYDISGALNITHVILQGTGHYLQTHENTGAGKGHGDLSEFLEKIEADSKGEIQKAADALSTLSRALVLMFYSTNGLFDANDIEAWKRLGINPDEITGEDGSTFIDLIQKNTGPAGMTGLQPAATDSWITSSYYADKVSSYAERRAKITDEVWDNFAARYAQVLINAAEQDAENRMNQKQDKNQQQENKNNDGNGGGQQDEDDDNPSPSQGSSGSGQSQRDGADPNPEAPENGSGGQDRQDENSDGQKSSRSGKGSGAQGRDEDDEAEGEDASVDVEGVGKMDGGEETTSTPQQSERQEHKEDDEPDDEGGGSNNNKSIRDLARNAKQEERENGVGQNDAGDEGRQDPGPQSDLDMSPDKRGGQQQGVDLAGLADGDWTEYRKRIAELNAFIMQVAADFLYVRQLQRQFIHAISRDKRELLPRGKLSSHIDWKRHQRFTTKRLTGQPVEIEDMMRFKKDERTTEPTSVELWVLIDGSDSMNTGHLGGGLHPIDCAVQSAAVLYEASKRPGVDFDAFVGMWGDNKIRIIAKPGDDGQKVGAEFQKLRKGIKSGTKLSPSFEQATDYSAKLTISASGKPRRFAGMTHFLILSDGDLDSGDMQPLVDKIITLFTYGPAVSVDIAVLNANENTNMHKVVEAVKEAGPGAAINIINETDPAQIPIRLSRQVKDRLALAGKEGVKAVVDTAKRKAFAAAHRLMARQNQM